jgi:hypothetical protein
VGLLTVLLVRAPEADVGPDRDERRTLVRPGDLDRRRDRLEVVAVLDPLGVPAVRLEPAEHILTERHRRRAIELDVVVVVQDDQPTEPEVAGERGRLGCDALLEVAVGADGVGPVIDDTMPGPVELRGEPPLGDRHPDGVREALAERPGGRLDAGRQAPFRMSGRDRAPLAERLQVLERDAVSSQVEERVQQHRGVPGGQHEAVAVGPIRVGRRVAKEPGPDRVGHGRHPHRGTRMSRVRLLDPVDGERPDRIDGELVEGVGGGGHPDRDLRYVGRPSGSGAIVRSGR